MLHSFPLSQCIIFQTKYLAFNIWSVSLSSHNWGRNDSIISQDRQRTMTVKSSRNILGTIWMVIWVKNIWRHSRWVKNYLYFSNLNFTMKGATVKTAILRFFLAGVSYVTPKNVNLDRPFTFFAHISKNFYKYQMSIFFIEYLGSLRPARTWLMYI